MSIPTQQENPEGLHLRYTLTKLDGEPVDPNADYFVLRLDSGGSDPAHITACRLAAEVYADAIEPYIPALAADLRVKLFTLSKSMYTNSRATRPNVDNYTQEGAAILFDVLKDSTKENQEEVLAKAIGNILAERDASVRALYRELDSTRQSQAPTVTYTSIQLAELSEFICQVHARNPEKGRLLRNFFTSARNGSFIKEVPNNDITG